uniref:Peroxisomal membrane protein PEX14-like KPWE domain-containing protein n=1 Tax=Neolamprologus brichardi TaxID=32507 RepID=A0A3Q4MGP4_NEOBR
PVGPQSPAGSAELSFAEVMRLVQEGKEVPGVTKVDIQPSNQNPTPSRMERMLKPWETASSSPESDPGLSAFASGPCCSRQCSVWGNQKS